METAAPFGWALQLFSDFLGGNLCPAAAFGIEKLIGRYWVAII